MHLPKRANRPYARRARVGPLQVIAGALDRARFVSYLAAVSPTVFRAGGYRFYFFSREEPRLHVHGQHAEGEAKFWLEPEIGLAQNYGLRQHQLAAAEQLIRGHEDEIRAAWHKHFPG
jgi:hypothetical protein